VKVLVVGEGGREDALAWALARSPKIRSLAALPGSDGIARWAKPVAIATKDLDAIVRHCEAERYDLVVVGPEAPLVAGLADRLRGADIPVFGPSSRAAWIEASKVFSKQFLNRQRIPTAGFQIFAEPDAAARYLRSSDAVYPLVLKADGLAAGKGVVIATEVAQAERTARDMLSGKTFGEAGARIVVEEHLTGREVSFFVLSDGKTFTRLATCQDYKRALDGDRGPNTGGMGSYSPSVHLDEATCRRIETELVAPTLAALAAEQRPYQGVLYVGVMLTEAGPRVLEFNARFGDPETQALLPRLDGDWLPLLHACAVGGLADQPVAWSPDASVCVVLASEGYPGPPVLGREIRGLDAAGSHPGVEVFHAGTRRTDGRWLTRGGRVLGVSARGATIEAAREAAYRAAGEIDWEGKQLRTDIALDAVALEGENRR